MQKVLTRSRGSALWFFSFARAAQPLLAPGQSLLGRETFSGQGQEDRDKWSVESKPWKRAAASQEVPSPYLILEPSELQLWDSAGPRNKASGQASCSAGVSSTHPLLDTPLSGLADPRPRPRLCCFQACRSLAGQERPRLISRANRHIYKVCAMFAQPLDLPAQPTCKLSPSPCMEPTRHGHGHLSPEVVRK